ncbi:MAG: exodeoxyribonuclease VII small subunit, partial [Spirochaetota bacterium]
PLEDAATLFEEGVRLAKGLDKDLQRIERKVRQLVNEPESPDEKPVLELFPELSEMADGTDEES